MKVAFALMFVIFFYIISYPFAKTFQLEGYDLSKSMRTYFLSNYEFGGKSNLVWTKRIVRLAIVWLMILIAINLPAFLLIENYWFVVLWLIIQFFILKLMFLFACAIVHPFEQLIKIGYEKRAIKILQNFKGTKIAITGSYGKTSTKNFLFEMLKTRYNVACTPKNYNTPMGLCKTALNVLTPANDVLIVEMGARRKGDIEKLMKMLTPTYGILTAVGEQHLETFGDLQTVKKTKFELCEHMCKGGVIVFDGASDNTLELYEKYPGEKKLAGKSHSFAYMDDLKMNRSGSSFSLHLDQKQVKIKTKLIGQAILNDLVLACAMAYLFGVDVQNIKSVARSLQPAPHRMQIIDAKTCVVIDDAYNSNFLGATQAVECLKLFDGKKIVITPGIVEGGNKQFELNFKLGKMIGQVASDVIVMNETNRTALSKGLMQSLSTDHIFFASTRQEQIEILQSLQTNGCVVLFENDLPDNYK